MVYDIQPLQITYMNDWGCEIFNYSTDEINAMGEDYYKKLNAGDVGDTGS